MLERGMGDYFTYRQAIRYVSVVNVGPSTQAREYQVGSLIAVSTQNHPIPEDLSEHLPPGSNVEDEHFFSVGKAAAREYVLRDFMAFSVEHEDLRRVTEEEIPEGEPDFQSDGIRLWKTGEPVGKTWR